MKIPFSSRSKCRSVIATLVLLSLTSIAFAQDSVKSTIISRDVIVKDGDTLQSLSKRELGRSGFASYLAEFNELVTSAPLIAGNIVRIPIHVPARGEFAEVLFVKGSVMVIRASQPQNSAGSNGSALPVAAQTTSNADAIPLSRSAKVHSGDVIITDVDGFASIVFSSGSVINLQPDTEASLQRLNCLPNDDSCLIEIITQRGKVTSDVETRDNQPVDFRIKTPFASAAVRGTVFDIDASDKLVLGVTEGDVDVSAEGSSIAIAEGFGSLVEAGQPPSDPIELLPAPVFKRVPARVANGDSVAWWSFDDAVSYNALLSSDESALETLATFEIASDTIAFEAIASGDYFLTVRAVDSNGLRGFTSNTRVTLADIDPDITPVVTSVTKQGREFLVSVENGPIEARGYEIQISGNDQFSDPLSVDVNESGSAVFRLDNQQVFTRARVLIDPFTVSAFGDISSTQ